MTGDAGEGAVRCPDASAPSRQRSHILYRCATSLRGGSPLTAALVELDFFKTAGDSGLVPDRLCQSLELSPRPADVAVTLFAALGLIARDGAALALTGTARDHLVRTSPFFWTLLRVLSVPSPGPQLCRGAAIGPAGELGRVFNRAGLGEGNADPAFAAQFTGAMDARGLFLGPAVADAVI